MRCQAKARGVAMWLLSLLLIGCFAHNAAAQNARLKFHQNFTSHTGIVVVGYAPATRAEIVDAKGNVIWSGKLLNTREEHLPVPDGSYQLRTDDEVKIVSTNMGLYVLKTADEIMSARRKTDAKAAESAAGSTASGAKRAGGMSGILSLTDGALSVVPVPAVKDATFASNPPSFASSHIVFLGVPTRLKAVIYNGVAPYHVSWNPGDGSAPITFDTSDPYVGVAATYTYNSPAVISGEQFSATVTVTDSSPTPLTVQGQYWMLVGDPSKQSDRVNRSSDEGLWYMHSQLYRFDTTSGAGGSTVTEGSYNDGVYYSYYAIHGSSMFAICLENTGHSITGGYNYSHDPNTDPYIDDLNRLINFLTDPTTLTTVATGYTKTYQTQTINGVTYFPLGADTFPADTHGPGGSPNGVVLIPNTGLPNYEGGAHLQAISQAGNVKASIPNRPEYASYYDLIGDFVDGFQYGQGTYYNPEGGWRYNNFEGVNDSDGSVVAWVSIGLRAAQQAYKLTPGPASGYPAPVAIAKNVTDALEIWLHTDQNYGDLHYAYDNGRGFNHNFDQTGGMGYVDSTYWENYGKTGGGLVALALVDSASGLSPDPRVAAAEGFLYRNFNNADYNAGWSSARDAYAMYNSLKGLSEFGINTLTDPTGGGGFDRDGFPLAPFNWFSKLADFIAGTSSTDLGHQAWNGNLPGYGDDGSYESTGTKPGDLWSVGASDFYGSQHLVTAWDVATLQSAVFVPPPIAVILHPSAAAGETYIPVQLNGADYYAVFDPGTSYELNPQATITHVHWDFGDGSSDDYNLPFTGPAGGAVPVVPGVHPAGNQTKHHYAAEGTYTATLTVSDDKGGINSTTVVVHVVPAPFSPTAILNVTAVGSLQDGDTVGVLADGTVTLKFDASSSYNISADSVLAPKNAKGISAFNFEWPTLAGGTVTSDPINPAGPYNMNITDVLFDEGANDVSGLLNPGSKAPVQTYKFQFNPASIPTAITIGLRVKSNIVQVGGLPPDTSTIFKQIFLKPNGQINPGGVQIKNLYVSNVTSASAIVNFDTITTSGSPAATTDQVLYGLTTAYGSTKSDGLLATHHAVTLNLLSDNTTYNLKVKVTDSPYGNMAQSGNVSFKTLPAPNPVLAYAVTSHSRAGSVETVTYTVTNTGGKAVNFYVQAGTYLASAGATFNSSTGPTLGSPATVNGAGGTLTFTVTWNLPAALQAPNVGNIQTKFTVKYQNALAANFAATPVKVVAVP